MTNDINIDEMNEDIEVDDLPPPMSTNQTIHCEPTMQSQSVRKRRPKLGLDLVKGFSEVVDKVCSSLKTDANERMGKFAESFIPVEDNYPKYLAVELKKLGFSYKDNLKISKAMRMDPSNVEVFKIIESEAEKMEFAMSFMSEE